MTISIIKPYIKRLKSTRSNPMRACVHEYKNMIKNEIENWEIFEIVSEIPDDADLVVVDYNSFKKDALQKINDSWEKMSIRGWIVFRDGSINRDKVKEFRKNNKITSIMTILDGWIWFQKEDYSDRSIKPVINDAVTDSLSNDVVYYNTRNKPDVPDWSGSHLKSQYLLNYASGPIFVETGTYLGQTVELVRRSHRHFRKILSIELDKNLANKSKEYFKFDPRINIIEGDSVDELKKICDEYGVEEPITFWLDAHASGPLPGGKTGPCPLIEELTAIKTTGRKDHTIFIDDRRLLGTAEWGGVSEEQVMNLIKEINPDYNIFYLPGEKENDIIVATTMINILDVGTFDGETVNQKHVDKSLHALVQNFGNVEPLPEEINNYFSTRMNPDIKASSEKIFGKSGSIKTKNIDEIIQQMPKKELPKGKIIFLEDL